MLRVTRLILLGKLGNVTRGTSRAARGTGAEANALLSDIATALAQAPVSADTGIGFEGHVAHLVRAGELGDAVADSCGNSPDRNLGSAALLGVACVLRHAGVDLQGDVANLILTRKPLEFGALPLPLFGGVVISVVAREAWHALGHSDEVTLDIAGMTFALVEVFSR